jgi:hypothetical protein
MVSGPKVRHKVVPLAKPFLRNGEVLLWRLLPPKAFVRKETLLPAVPFGGRPDTDRSGQWTGPWGCQQEMPL